MPTIKRVNKARALEMIAEINYAIDSFGPSCPLTLVKLGRYHYDTTGVDEKVVLEFIKDWQRRQINRPEFGATRI